MAVIGGPDSIVMDGIIGHWDVADKNSYPGSGATWTDLSDSGNNATITNATFSSGNAGSLNFDGNGDYAYLGSNTSTFINLTAVSVECWFYRNGAKATSGGYDMIFDSYTGSTGTINLGLDISSDPEPAIWTVTGGWATTGAAISDSTWYHMVGTSSEAVDYRYIYINGRLWDSHSATTDLGTSGNFTIGGRQTDDSHHFNGLIPLVRMYNKELSAAEVLQNFNAHKSRFGL